MDELLNGFGDAIFLFGQNNKILACNDVALDRMGYTWDEMSQLEPMNLVDPSCPRVKENQGVLWGSSDIVESRHVTKAGQVIPVEVCVRSLSDWKGQGPVLFAIVRDISIRKRTERKMKQAIEDLKDFARMAAHDLKEPARTIIAFSSIVREEGSPLLNSELQGYLKLMHEAGQTLSHLVDSLFAFSVASTRQMTFSSLSLEAMFQELTAILAQMIQETDAQIQFSCDCPDEITADPLLRQVFQNLLTNSIKYKQVDTRPIIDIICSHTPDNFRFQVADNGQGIPPEFQEKVFLPFRRLSHQPGGGVGLTIAKKIIENHGGNIWLNSEPGRGTKVFFDIPIPPRADGGQYDESFAD
jgi:PAS domain S-box-containing protein